LRADALTGIGPRHQRRSWHKLRSTAMTMEVSVRVTMLELFIIG